MSSYAYLIDGISAPLCEDVYILDSRGIAFLRREIEPTGAFDLFERLPLEEREFVVNNRTFCPTHKVLLVISEDGRPIFVDSLFYSRFRIMVAILPHFGLEKIKSFISRGFGEQLLISPSAEEALKACREVIPEPYEDELAMRISVAHPVKLAYMTEHMTNAELLDTMVGVADTYADFYGCDINLRADSVTEYDIDNTLCLYTYGMVYACLCLITRIYSATRSGKFTINFGKVGIYCDLEFKFAHALLVDGKPEMPELDRLLAICTVCQIPLEVTERSENIALRLFPWKREPHSSDIKQPFRGFRE